MTRQDWFPRDGFYTALGVEKKGGVLSVVQISGTIGGEEKIQKYGAVGGSVIELGLEVFENGTRPVLFPGCDRKVAAGG